MAIKYTKPLKTAEFKTLNGATTVTVEDTIEKPVASMAIAEFMRGDIIHANDTMIPFHAVDSVKVTVVTSDEIEKEDPYCKEEEETPEP